MKNVAGSSGLRWFSPQLTAYGRVPYYEIQADPDGNGYSFLEDIYPGEQYTFAYSFTYPDHKTSPKLLICRSWDRDITFWWAKGA